MTDSNSGGFDDVLATTTADDAASDTPTEENTQTNAPVGTDNIKEEVETADAPEAPEGKEEDPDAALLKMLENPKLPLNKVKRIKELVQQKNANKQEAETVRQELEALRKEKESWTASQTKGNDQTKVDVTKTSTQTDELLNQLPEVEFEPMFEYVTGEDGKITGYKDPSKTPQTVEEIAKAIYPQFEKNLLKRVEMMTQIRDKQVKEAEAQSKQFQERSEAELREEVSDSFGEDLEGKDEYIRTLEKDYEVFKERHPGKPMDIRAHLEFYMNHIYKKSPGIEKNNLDAAKKVSKRSTSGGQAPVRVRTFDDVINL